MGYFLDNTEEIEYKGEKVRVSKADAEIIKAKLNKTAKKTAKKEE